MKRRRNEKRRLRARRLRPAAPATPRDPTSQNPQNQASNPAIRDDRSRKTTPAQKEAGRGIKAIGDIHIGPRGTPAMLPEIAKWPSQARKPLKSGLGKELNLLPLPALREVETSEARSWKVGVRGRFCENCKT